MKKLFIATMGVVLLVGAQSAMGNKELLEATRRNDLNQVRNLIKKQEVNVNFMGENASRSPLHMASEYGYTEIVELLLENRAEVDIKNYLGNAPLHYTTSEVVVKLLLDKGANVNAKNNFLTTPLHLVTSEAVAKLLLDKGAQVNAKNKDGSTPLDYAKTPEIREIIKGKGGESGRK